jgi:hypothetical protein
MSLAQAIRKLGRSKNVGTKFHACTKANPQEWYTPKYILDALGIFDLDPCSPLVRPFDTAKVHYTKADDGLAKPWSGRVWLNPPYDRKTIRLWMKKMADHRNGIALVFMRQGTRWFDELVPPYCTAYLVPTGNLAFIPGDGQRAKRAPNASVLIAYDPLDIGDVPLQNWSVLKSSGLLGTFVDRLGNWLKARKERKQQRQSHPYLEKLHDSQEAPSQVNTK